MEGFIYFIEAVGSRVDDSDGNGRGFIKIGWSKTDPQGRLDCMQVGCPHELRLLATVPGSCTEERRWHLRFDWLRVRGEWFEPDDELLAAIHAGDRSYEFEVRRRALIRDAKERDYARAEAEERAWRRVV
jgi:hypothetical protein